MDTEIRLNTNKETNKRTKEFKNPQQLSIISFSRSDLIQHSSNKLKQKKFINAVNRVHFFCGKIFTHIVYLPTNEEYLIEVFPEPCRSNEITCSFSKDFMYNPKDIELKNLIIDDGKIISLMPIEPVIVSGHLFKAKIREYGYVVSERNGKRFRCQMVSALITQGDNKAGGKLDDFNPNGLKIAIHNPEGHVFDLAGNLNIDLYRQEQCVFSGPCRCIRMEEQNNSIILQPLNIKRSMYRERESRNPRLNLVPSPRVVFDHPFNRKNVEYDISDITNSGFSVQEKLDQSLLMPGLVLEDVNIIYAGEIKIKCDAQVVYARKLDKNTIRFGFAIKDINVKTYNRLFNIISSAHDPHSQVSYKVDMGSLWDFFFESGFLYPEKYACINQYKEEFKKTYETLYHNCPEIFASITYQNNGQIFGHVSLIKAYEKTWMVHHLAAKHMGKKSTGLNVLDQILNYLDGFYRMPSVGMKYLLFYFRPENKFPDYFFGGACRAYNDPSRLSMDILAHLSLDINQDPQELPDGWSMRECSSEDIKEMKNSYKQISDGLMIDAFCLDAENYQKEQLETVYAQKHLRRRYRCHTLLHEEERKAYFIEDHSNKGINLSDLLNSVKVIVPDVKSVPWNVMFNAISMCGQEYGTKNITLHVFPCEYLDHVEIKYEKRYVMWVLDVRYIDQIIQIVKKMYKVNPLKIIKSFFRYIFRT